MADAPGSALRSRTATARIRPDLIRSGGTLTVSSLFRARRIAKSSEARRDGHIVPAGGARVAALTCCVLEEPHDTRILIDGNRRRLLDETDITSSVSGVRTPVYTTATEDFSTNIGR